MSDEPQRITKRQSNDDSWAIVKQIKALQAQGYPYKQATAIALRQWNDGELVVTKQRESSDYRRARQAFSALKTLALLRSVFGKTAEKQKEEIRKEQDKKSK